MDYPEYVTREEVQRICRELGFRDWTALQTTAVLPEEARRLQQEVGEEALQISAAAFQTVSGPHLSGPNRAGVIG